MAASVDHKLTDQNSGAASSTSFSLGTEGEVKKWWRGTRRSVVETVGIGKEL